MTGDRKVPSNTARRRVRLRALRYLTTFIAPALAVAGFLVGGLWTWALPIHAFLLIPLLEWVMGTERMALSAEEESAALADPLFDAILYFIVPMQWTLLIIFLFTLTDVALSGWEYAGNIASMGILCGIYGINVAHELGHRATRWERNMARALLLTSLYMHFIIEHNRGHHRRVATSDDPASARYGESVQAFWIRSIAFGLLSAWRLEVGRLARKGRTPVSLRNEVLVGLFMQMALLVLVGVVFGGKVLIGFGVAALIGILLLETVNYIEHYGLQRRRSTNGGHVKVEHVHSWNSDHLLGRLTLFELTRHSDHHWNATRKYQILRSYDEAPQMPLGYPGMMIVSLFPPLFRRMVHPRLHALVARHRALEL